MNLKADLTPWLVGSLILHLGAAGTALLFQQQPTRLAGSAQSITIHLVDSIESRQSPTPQTEPLDTPAEKKLPQSLVSSTSPLAKPAIALQPKKTASKPPANNKQRQATQAPDKPLEAPIETNDAINSRDAIAGQPGVPHQPAVQQALFNADYLHNPKPKYPAISMRLGEQGTVLLHVHVSQDGKPLDISVKKSSGFRRLDQAAVKVVKKWQFVPAQQGPVALESWVDVPVQFSLQKQSGLR